MGDDTFLSNPIDDVNPLDAIKRDEKLPNDFATPAAPPSDVQDNIGIEDPATDIAGDASEVYDAGTEAAAGVTLPGETTREP